MAGTSEGKRMSVLEVSSTKDFMKAMECPVCLQVFVPPVYQCNKGHPFCSNCSNKLTTCPQCRSDLSDKSRCYVLEYILEVVLIACRYKSEGCNDPVTSSDTHDHETTCNFRPVKCKEAEEILACCNSEVPYGQYLDHLKVQHKCTSLARRIISKRQIIHENRYRYAFRLNIIEHVGRHFLMKVWIKKDYIGVYVVMFGSDDDATKYNACIYVGHPVDESKRHVVKIYNLKSFRVLESNPNFFSVKLPKSHLTSIGPTVNDQITFHVSCIIQCDVLLQLHRM